MDIMSPPTELEGVKSGGYGGKADPYRAKKGALSRGRPVWACRGVEFFEKLLKNC